MSSLSKKKFQLVTLWTAPSIVLLLCLTIVPLVMLLVFSFMNRNIFAGEPWPGWTMNNLTRMIESNTFWRLLGKSLMTALKVTLICIVAAYPTAWAIAKIVKPKNRSIFMMVVILPFFTSQLLLIYAMMNLIQSGGLLLTFLDAIGFHNVPTMLYTNKATILILTYEYLPYMILCLYSSLEGIGDNLIQASLILGANKWKTFTNIVFPMSVPGLLSGGQLYGTRPGWRRQRRDGRQYDRYAVFRIAEYGLWRGPVLYAADRPQYYYGTGSSGDCQGTEGNRR